MTKLKYLTFEQFCGKLAKDMVAKREPLEYTLAAAKKAMKLYHEYMGNFNQQERQARLQ